MDRRNGLIPKDEPQVLWQDKDICVLSKGAGWIVAISRDYEQNKFLSGLLRSAGIRDVRDLVNSGKYEHLCHYVSLKFKEDKEYVLSNSNDHEFGLAHRLDVDTSGALMLGKSLQGFTHLRQSFTSHQVFKEYICLVHGPVKKATDQVNLPILWDEHSNVSTISEQGMWAKSIYTVLGRYRLKGGKNVFTLCRVVIITGRTHQIRIHMAAIGHPLVGDSKYNRRHAQTDIMWCPRMFLHAWRIGFWDCARAWHEVKAPLPRDLARSLRTLEAVQLDLDNEGNPSCRIVAPPAPAKESPAVVPTPPVASAGREPPPAPKPPPPPPKAPPVAQGAGEAAKREVAPAPPADRDRVVLPNGVTLEVPNYLPPPVPEEAPPAQPARACAAEPGPLPPPPPPPPPPLRPPRAGGAAGQAQAPAGPTAPEPAAPPGKTEPASSKKEANGWKEVGGRKQHLAAADQAHLEELCCDLAKKALLSLPRCQSSVGHLGSMRDVASVLQQMGSKRPKLSKMLRERPETFTFLGTTNSEQLVSLSQKAMALARLEQVARVQSATEASAAEAVQRAASERERIAQQEERHWAEFPPPSMAGRRPAVAPWSVDHRSYEEPCAMLVEMGFERQSALRALRANHGDVMEAMDHLSSMPSMYGPATGEDSGDPGPRKAREEAEKAPGAPADDEEEMLRRALALSQQEEEERKRRQELDEEALEAALAKSLQQGRSAEDCDAEAVQLDDDERDMREALEQSKRLEEERKRQEQLEEAEVERAIRESMPDFELFHASGNDLLEETLRHSLVEPQAEDEQSYDEEWQSSWEAIQKSYNDASVASDAYEDNLAPYWPMSLSPLQSNPDFDQESRTSPRKVGSAAERWLSQGCLAAADFEQNLQTTWHKSSSSSPCDALPMLRSSVHEVDGWAGQEEPSPCSLKDEPNANPCPASAKRSSNSGFSLQEWLFQRMRELQVGFDCNTLWMALNEIEEDLLGEEEVLKMWLGFPVEDKLPDNITQLVSEFGQKRQLLRFCAD